jgi:hypothetical protein
MIKNSFAPVPKSHTQIGFIDVKKPEVKILTHGRL